MINPIFIATTILLYSFHVQAVTPTLSGSCKGHDPDSKDDTYTCFKSFSNKEITSSYKIKVRTYWTCGGGDSTAKLKVSNGPICFTYKRDNFPHYQTGDITGLPRKQSLIKKGEHTIKFSTKWCSTATFEFYPVKQECYWIKLKHHHKKKVCIEKCKL